jgi:hypothetical protein
LGTKLPLLSRRSAIPSVRFDTRDCNASPIMSLISFLELEIIGDVHGAEEGLDDEAMACFWFLVIALGSDGDCASSGSCGDDI